MQRFAELFEALDTTTSTNAKVAAMVAYLRSVEPLGCRLGHVCADRPPSETQRGPGAAAPLAGRGSRPARLAGGGCLCIGGRSRRDHRAAGAAGPGAGSRNRRAGSERVVRATHPAVAPTRGIGATRAGHALVAVAVLSRELPRQQTAHRVIARGRIAHARDARARRAAGSPARGDRTRADRRLGTGRTLLAGAERRHHFHRAAASLSVLPGLAARTARHGTG